MEQAFITGAREEVNAIIAKMFYSDILPFNLTRNPYNYMIFTYAAINPIVEPPGYNALS